MMKTVTTLVFLALPAFGMGGDPSCPTAIRETIPGYENSDPAAPKPAFTSMRGIHAAMLRCPNITTLQVRVALMGCSEWPDRFNFPFDPRGGEQYASTPAVLSLDGYEVDESDEWDSCRDRFGHSWDSRLRFLSRPSTAWPCLRYLLLPAAQRNKSNFDLWLDAMDFSRIHTLQLNNTRGGHYMLTEKVAATLGPRLHSLESLLVHNAVAEQLMLALPDVSLKHLSWQNPMRKCDDVCDRDASGASALGRVLERHGPTLQSFEYRTDETDSRAPPVVHLDEVRVLGTLAPKLVNLTLDLDREMNGTESGEQWPWGKLKVVAESLPELTDLTIHFALGSECQRQRRDNPWYPIVRCEGPCIGADRYAQPMLNNPSAAEMSRFLWQHKAGQQFKSITFKTGDWTAPWDGPLATEGWLDGQRAWATCTMGGSQANSKGEADDHAHTDITCHGGHTLTLDSSRDYCRGWSREGMSVDDDLDDL